jgi:predicted RNase H-like HicB family nuclease
MLTGNLERLNINRVNFIQYLHEVVRYFYYQEFKTMKNEYTAVMKQINGWWIGWIEEVPGVNCQEKTYEKLKESLEITLKEALEFNRQDALAAVGSEYIEDKISI